MRMCEYLGSLDPKWERKAHCDTLAVLKAFPNK